ncbi:hypothetical protein EVAR_47675_1 [Eumeta japonica]|uniref:Uncharacterized protein n=1 Tax=Eumeta variegata TaxID=151549 RepID=A0A4C1Y2A8_EUMVA|nr:hypothetical protein EVAR_47675_1 [Eumeta japonica]
MAVMPVIGSLAFTTDPPADNETLNAVYVQYDIITAPPCVGIGRAIIATMDETAATELTAGPGTGARRPRSKSAVTGPESGAVTEPVWRAAAAFK